MNLGDGYTGALTVFSLYLYIFELLHKIFPLTFTPLGFARTNTPVSYLRVPTLAWRAHPPVFFSPPYFILRALILLTVNYKTECLVLF